MQKAALLQATQINIARFCVLTRLFYHAFWNFSIAQPKKSLQKSPSGTISILVTPPVRLIVRMRMRKMRFNRNAVSIFYGYIIFCFFPSTMPYKRRQVLRGDYSFRINYTIFSTVFQAREKVNTVITTGKADGYDCVILRIHPIPRNRLFRGLFARVLPLPLRADCAAWHPP